MSVIESHDEHVPRGRIETWRRSDGVWGVSWYPKGGDPAPGVTYARDDPERPGDFPGRYDVETLIEWGKARWGGAPAT
ncbi:MAG TPA: hypothetical protein VKR21_06255 [Solirubrobacteraceae bacterium]|nr:hypothetical protein [Solirubrobacteraceae bacterium]